MLPSLDDPEAISAWLAERDTESAAFTDQARQRLFDEWFASATRRSRSSCTKPSQRLGRE
jgi:hypothetical protein